MAAKEEGASHLPTGDALLLEEGVGAAKRRRLSAVRKGDDDVGEPGLGRRTNLGGHAVDRDDAAGEVDAAGAVGVGLVKHLAQRLVAHERFLVVVVEHHVPVHLLLQRVFAYLRRLLRTLGTLFHTCSTHILQ